MVSIICVAQMMAERHKFDRGKKNLVKSDRFLHLIRIDVFRLVLPNDCWVKSLFCYESQFARFNVSF